MHRWCVTDVSVCKGVSDSYVCVCSLNVVVPVRSSTLCGAYVTVVLCIGWFMSSINTPQNNLCNTPKKVPGLFVHTAANPTESAPKWKVHSIKCNQNPTHSYHKQTQTNRTNKLPHTHTPTVHYIKLHLPSSCRRHGASKFE